MHRHRVEFTTEERDALLDLLAARIAVTPRLVVEDLINAPAYHARSALYENAQRAISAAKLVSYGPDKETPRDDIV